MGAFKGKLIQFLKTLHAIAPNCNGANCSECEKHFQEVKDFVMANEDQMTLFWGNLEKMLVENIKQRKGFDCMEEASKGNFLCDVRSDLWIPRIVKKLKQYTSWSKTAVVIKMGASHLDRVNTELQKALDDSLIEYTIETIKLYGPKS